MFTKYDLEMLYRYVPFLLLDLRDSKSVTRPPLHLWVSYFVIHVSSVNGSDFLPVMRKPCSVFDDIRHAR